MMRLWVAFVLVLILSSSAFAGDYLMNDTDDVITGLRVVFSEPVTITGYGDVLIAVEPQGESTEFVFSGGEVDAWGGQWLNWEPGSATIITHEWLREDETERALSQTDDTLGPTPGYDPKRTETPWWEETNVLLLEIRIPSVIDDIVNVIFWGGNAESESHQMYVRYRAEHMHAKGGHYVALISTFNANTYEIYEKRPELASSAVIDAYGRPMTVPWESKPEMPLWWGNTNDPTWQAFLLEQAQSLVDAGVDGIAIDEIAGTASSVWFGGSFGEPDMTMFRDYLADVYTAQELSRRFHIRDIERFDYGEYIHDRGLEETWMNTPWEVPLYDDFLRFQRLAIVEFMTELINGTKAYSRTTYGRDVSFTANLFGLDPDKLVFSDLLDYYTVEYPYMERGYPPESQAIPACKLARALGDKPAVLLADIRTNADLIQRTSSSTLMTIYIAEAYGSQSMMLVPYDIYAWNEEIGAGRYHGHLSVLAPVYRFIHDNPFLYEDLDSLARVAVVYSFPTDYHRWKYRDSFRGLTYALLDGQVQFDIVAFGDDVWLADPSSKAGLAPYDLVFLPAAECLSLEQVNSLLTFVNKGGTVVACGDTGIYNEKGESANRRKLKALTSLGTHSYGDGWFIMLDGDPGDAYRQSHNSDVLQQLVSLVDDHATRVTTASSPRTLNVLTYEKPGNSWLVTHLINYDYDIRTDSVQPTEPFTLTLRPPDGFLSQSETQLYLLSPHRSEPLSVDFQVVDGALFINHPGMEIYDVLVALPEDDDDPQRQAEAGVCVA